MAAGSREDWEEGSAIRSSGLARWPSDSAEPLSGTTRTIRLGLTPRSCAVSAASAVPSAGKPDLRVGVGDREALPAGGCSPSAGSAGHRRPARGRPRGRPGGPGSGSSGPHRRRPGSGPRRAPNALIWLSCRMDATYSPASLTWPSGPSNTTSSARHRPRRGECRWPSRRRSRRQPPGGIGCVRAHRAPPTRMTTLPGARRLRWARNASVRALSSNTSETIGRSCLLSISAASSRSCPPSGLTTK